MTAVIPERAHVFVKSGYWYGKHGIVVKAVVRPHPLGKVIHDYIVHFFKHNGELRDPRTQFAKDRVDYDDLRMTLLPEGAENAEGNADQAVAANPANAGGGIPEGQD